MGDTTITFDNAWEGIGIFMSLAAAILLLLVLKSPSRSKEGKTKQNLQTSLSSWLLRLIGCLIYFALAFVVAVVLNVGLHRCYSGIHAESSGLTLDYPWPRPDVRLNWSDITKVEIETKRFRRAERYSLRVETGSVVHRTLWIGDTKREIIQGREIIQAHLARNHARDP